jgi:hypothetical protein
VSALYLALLAFVTLPPQTMVAGRKAGGAGIADSTLKKIHDRNKSSSPSGSSGTAECEVDVFIGWYGPDGTNPFSINFRLDGHALMPVPITCLLLVSLTTVGHVVQGEDPAADFEALNARIQEALQWEVGSEEPITSLYNVMRYGYNHEIIQMDGTGIGYTPRALWDENQPDYLPNKTFIVCTGNFDKEYWTGHFNRVKSADGGCGCTLM